MPLVPRNLNPHTRTGCVWQPFPKAPRPEKKNRLAQIFGGRRDKIQALNLLLIFALAVPVFAGVPVRDLVMVSGARDNQLVGYGLVVGLAGDGDKDRFTRKQTIANMLQRYGINRPRRDALREKRRASVMVTADIPAFVKPGARLDVRWPRWATPNHCKAACCCRRRCSARTTRFMPWRRARCPSADSPPAPAAAAARA